MTELADAVRRIASIADEFWLDSGALLGLIREGNQLGWDSDIDFGLWESQAGRIEAGLPGLRAEGFRIVRRSYRNRIYGYTFKAGGGGPSRPINLHFFFRRGDLAWAPQTVTFRETGRPAALQGFEPWPKTRSAMLHMSKAARERAGSVRERVAKYALWMPLWGAYVVSRNRLDRDRWSGWPHGALYGKFTWVIPARFFDRLDSTDFQGLSVPTPCDVEAYLTLRYGDWRMPVRDWCYWVDDGCIEPGDPEAVLARHAALR